MSTSFVRNGIRSKYKLSANRSFGRRNFTEKEWKKNNSRQTHACDLRNHSNHHPGIAYAAAAAEEEEAELSVATNVAKPIQLLKGMSSVSCCVVHLISVTAIPAVVLIHRPCRSVSKCTDVSTREQNA